jgi:hypothetical protein
MLLALLLVFIFFPFIWFFWKLAFAIAIVSILLWAFGMLMSLTMGGLIHVLLVFAVIAVLIRVIRGPVRA